MGEAAAWFTEAELKAEYDAYVEIMAWLESSGFIEIVESTVATASSAIAGFLLIAAGLYIIATWGNKLYEGDVKLPNFGKFTKDLPMFRAVNNDQYYEKLHMYE